MPERPLAQLSAGDRVLLKWSGPATIGLETGSTDLALRGELEVRILPFGSPSRRLDLVRMGVGSPFGVARDPVVGEIGISGKRTAASGDGRGEMRPNGDGRWSFELAIDAAVLYPEIEDRWGLERVADDLLMPRLEQYRGRLEGEITETVTSEQSPFLQLTGHLNLERFGESRGSVRAITESLEGTAAILPTSEALGQWGPARASNRRTLRIRPVFFVRADGSHSGDLWGKQLEKAQLIWQKCCVEFKELKPPALVPEEGINFNEPSSVSNSHIEEAVCEIFVIPGKVRYQPIAIGGGMGLDRIMLPEDQAKTRTLAHELGHVLSGVHPGGATLDHQWVGYAGSLLDPKHMSDNVAVDNCRRLHNVHLDTDVAVPCRLDS